MARQRERTTSAQLAGEAGLGASLETWLDPVVVLAAARDEGGAIVDFVYEFANRAAAGCDRLETDELIGARMLQFAPRRIEAALFDALRRVVETGEPLIVDEYPFADPRGDASPERYFDVRAGRFGDGVACTWRDVTARKRTELSDARLAAIVRSSGDAIIGLDAATRIQSWNQAAEVLYGYTAHEVVGESIAILFAPSNRTERERVLALEPTATMEHFETEDMRKDGTTVDVALTSSPIRDEAGRVIGSARITRDISERKRLERELLFYADHDALTGLFNRRRLSQELARQVAHAARYPDAVGALLVGDLDNFKNVNDTLGHRAGDELITGVARTMRSRLRETDVLARLGGDEFAVLLPRTDAAQAQLAADALREAVRGFEAVIAKRRVHTTISIGIAMIGGDQPAADTLAAADLAMYDAKRKGRDRVALADDTELQQHRLAGTLGWSQRLRDALDHERFELYAQPIVDVANGTIPYRELLLRMHGDDGEIVEPGAFIAAAERFGMIAEIDRWVSCEAIRLLAGDATGSSAYAVNLSGISIADEDLLTVIERELSSAAIDPARLTFEFTETAAIVNVDAARKFTLGLQRIGCASALDDFGSGFGSFSHLRHLPVDYLKIDGGYVRQLPGSNKDRVLLKAIIDLAHGLNTRTIAEHVSSEKGMTLLRTYGADLAQGYFLGPPQPIPGGPGA